MRIAHSDLTMKDPRDPFVQTQDSLQRSIEACRQERIRAGIDPDTGQFPESAGHILDATLDHLDLPDATILRVPRPNAPLVWKVPSWDLRLRIHNLETEAEGLKVRLSQLHDEIEDCYRQLMGEQ